MVLALEQTVSVCERQRLGGFVMNYKDLCVFVLILFLTKGTDAMTKAQMKNTMKMLKTSCMKKIQVTEDLVEGIPRGQFIEDKKVMCYVACIYEMTNLIKNNKISFESFMKQIDLMYPPELKEDAKGGAIKCKDVHKKYKDICEAAFFTSKCVYEFKPEAFIFP